MGTRIFCFVIVIVFLASVVGYAGWAIHQHVTTETTPPPKTTAEIAQERLEQLNLGNLENYQPPEEEIEARRIEDLSPGEGDIYVVSDDVITLQARYALAESGQVIYETFQEQEGAGRTQAAGTFCRHWSESLEGMKVGGQRRLFLPAGAIFACLEGLSQEVWLEPYEFIIDVELVGIADRPTVALEDLEDLGSLSDFTPASPDDEDRRLEDETVGSGEALRPEDIAIVQAKYALSGDGRIAVSTEADRNLRPADFCRHWSESLEGMKVGGIRRLYLQEFDIVACRPPLSGWPPGEGLVVEVELKGVYDRTFAELAPRRTPAVELIVDDVSVGEGATATPGQELTVDYIGMLASDGWVFDSGRDFVFILASGQVIDGWVDGLAGMKAGGVRRLTIPSAQAYGPAGRAGIPPDADLIFEVKLTSVKPPSEE